MLLVVIGDDLHGSEEVVDLLNEWLDARHLATEAFERASDEERERPPYWRYFRALAPRGCTSLFLGAYYLHAIADRLRRRVDHEDLVRQLEHMRRVWLRVGNGSTDLDLAARHRAPYAPCLCRSPPHRASN
jgi:polyphosphate kinase 2 (PPK2 family)